MIKFECGNFTTICSEGKKFYATDKFQKLEMDSDSLYLALTGEKWKILFFQKKTLSGIVYVPKNAPNFIPQTQQTIFSQDWLQYTQEAQQERTRILQRGIWMFKEVVYLRQNVLLQWLKEE